MLTRCLALAMVTVPLCVRGAARCDERLLRLPAPSDAPEAEQTAAEVPLDLGGDWLLTLPAGFQYRVSFESLGEEFYRLRGAKNLAGKYERRGDRLYMSEPDRERHTVATWQLLNANTLTLIDETGASGARYAGATLGRQLAPDAELPRTAPVVSATD